MERVVIEWAVSGEGGDRMVRVERVVTEETVIFVESS